MEKVFVTCMLLSIFFDGYAQSAKQDTLFYDQNWKGVESKTFATFYRILSDSGDSNFGKRFRDYYITGELQSEGGFITIDKYDDANSIFDGEWTRYYKSGKVEEKGNRIKGKQEGEYTKYNEDGLVLIHAYLKNDKLDGVYTEFSEEKDLCIQIEYKNGKPLYDYYVVSNKDGFCSKLRLSDDQPIYESPTLDEKQVEYKDGKAWSYYNKNGIMVGLTNNKVRDYGKYFQIPVIIANNSMYPIDFNPDNTTATLTDKKGIERVLKVYSAEEYMKKVKRIQNWNMALTDFSEGLAAANAGYSSSTTNTSYSDKTVSKGKASVYGSGGYAYGKYSGTTSSQGQSSSTTTSYDGAAAYQARIIASERVAAYENALLSERAAKDEGYLKRTTIYPGETISGYINIERKKGVSMDVVIDINGVKYSFPWDISK